MRLVTQCKSAKWFLPETTAYIACLLSTDSSGKSFQNAITDEQVCVFQADALTLTG